MILLRRHKAVVKPKKKKSRFGDVSWDYNGWQGSNYHQPLTQRDWNQTLITKINQCSAQIHKESLCGGGTVIECGTNLEVIFEDLEYYHSNEKQLASRYRVVFKEELQNIVKIYNEKVPALSYNVHVQNVRAFAYVGKTQTNNRRLLLCKKKKLTK